jgi:hypothetical protein
MLIIRGVEVTQGIQYFRADQHLTDPTDRGPDNSLTLVANKPAWVRVYVESDAPGTIPNVTGTLDVNYGLLNESAGQPGVTLNPQAPGSVTAQFTPDYATTRAATALTLNFIIPADRMVGPLVLKATVTAGGQTAVTDLFIAPSLRQTLRLRGIMIGYNGPDPANPANNLTIAAPGLADLQATAAWALRVMPVRADAVFEVASTITRNVPLTGMATNGGCASGWIALNSAIAVAKTADGNHPGFLYYGLIAATFPNQSNNGGCESSGVSSGFNGGQIALAHEIGHACGRAHAPCGGVGTSADPSYPAYEPYDASAARVASIGEYGLDITNGTVPTPATGRDYMSYCGPGWVSIYGHRALVNNSALNPEQVGVRRPWWRDYVRYDPWWWLHYKPDPPPYWIDPQIIREFPPRMHKVITIIGVIHPDDRVEVLSVTRSEVMSVELIGKDSGLRAVLQGAKGVELASSPIVEMSSHGSCGCADPEGPQRPVLFQAFVPDVAVGSALSIRRRAETVWRRVAPKGKATVNPPKVRRSGDGAVDVTWTATVPGGAKDIWLCVSADQGKTWKAVATGLTGRRAVVDRAHLPVGKLLFQVAVHDGFRSVFSKAVSFENTALPPVPAILHPHERQTLVAGETLYLWGSVAAQPGESGQAFRYSWKLDGKPAGDGLHVFTRVPAAGSHLCELAVQNARGQTLCSCSVEFVSVAAEDRKA